MQTILENVKNEEAEKEKPKFPPVKPVTWNENLKQGQTTWKCLDNSVPLTANNRQIPPFCEHEPSTINKDAKDALKTVNSEGSKHKSTTNMGKADKKEKPKDGSLAQLD